MEARGRENVVEEKMVGEEERVGEEKMSWKSADGRGGSEEIGLTCTEVTRA